MCSIKIYLLYNFLFNFTNWLTANSSIFPQYIPKTFQLFLLHQFRSWNAFIVCALQRIFSPRSLHHLERETAAFLFQQLLSPVQCYEGISWAPLRKFIRFHLELNERNWGLRCGFVTHSSRFKKNALSLFVLKTVTILPSKVQWYDLDVCSLLNSLCLCWFIELKCVAHRKFSVVFDFSDVKCL